MSSTRERIAANIKRYRQKAGLTVDEVGAAVGKSGKTISAWEVGRGQPDADATVLLCRKLGIDLRELYGEPSDKYSLSEDEIELLELYRGTVEFGRSQILQHARLFHKEMPRLGSRPSVTLYADMTEEEVNQAISDFFNRDDG